MGSFKKRSEFSNIPLLKSRLLDISASVILYSSTGRYCTITSQAGGGTDMIPIISLPVQRALTSHRHRSSMFSTIWSELFICAPPP